MAVLGTGQGDTGDKTLPLPYQADPAKPAAPPYAAARGPNLNDGSDLHD